MMTKTGDIKVKARSADGAVVELQLELSHDKERRLRQIRLMGAEEAPAIFAETDLYKAMQSLREHLETKGVQLLSAGARPDVVPSGMSRDVGSARTAYFIQIGTRS